jgi:SagB-type dehydrogenase family enzyme
VARAREIRLRRSEYVIAYWQRGRLVVYEYENGRLAGASPPVIAILDVLDDWRTVADVVARLPRYRPADVRVLLGELRRLGFVVTDGHPAGNGMNVWRPWHPAAGVFHFSTKDTPFSQHPMRGEARLRRKAVTTPMPPPEKVLSGLPRIQLHSRDRSGEFVETLRARRTWRSFAKSPVRREDVEALLQVTWGVTARGRVPGQGDVFLKTSPSGGARHPTEVYLVAIDVNGLERGLYYYQPSQHALVRLPTAVDARTLAGYLPGQRWYHRAPALFVMTTVFAREVWRYPFARAYRATLLDAGHLCQTFCLAATWLKLAPFCTMALADSRIEADLGIDGRSESVVYAAGVGVRPRGGWRPGIPGAKNRRLLEAIGE